MTTPFTGNETIADILLELPESAEILASHGLSCTSCHLNQYEPLIDGIKTHGWSDEDAKRVLDDLNEAKSEQRDFNVLLPPVVTKSALSYIERLQSENYKDSPYLKIEAETIDGEREYFLDFITTPEKEDKTFYLASIQLSIDPESLELLQKITIDYEKKEKEEGFTFTRK